jgi:hypothetical protein
MLTTKNMEPDQNGQSEDSIVKITIVSNDVAIENSDDDDDDDDDDDEEDEEITRIAKEEGITLLKKKTEKAKWTPDEVLAFI